MTPYKKGSKFYIKMYGIEYELVIPTEEVSMVKPSKIKVVKKKTK